jgi:hypothetical protein
MTLKNTSPLQQSNIMFNTGYFATLFQPSKTNGGSILMNGISCSFDNKFKHINLGFL